MADYAPWCPACKALEDTWNKFGARSSALGIKVGKVDVITSPGLSGRFMVTALPTIFQKPILFNNHIGGRKERTVPFAEYNHLHSAGRMILIHTSEKTRASSKSSPSTVKGIYEQFPQKAREYYEMCGVYQYFNVMDGEFRQYRGSRDGESLITFIQEKKWTQIDPVPAWKSPNSIQMTIVSSFFKLSQNLRDLHNEMTEDFGLPTWGSYLIFAIATILIGAILGLVLVCFLDLIYPPKQVDVESRTIVKKGKRKDSEDELADEDIEDDLVDDAGQLDSRNKLRDSDSDPNYDFNASNKFKKRRAWRAD